jgi:hypothetical protein
MCSQLCALHRYAGAVPLDVLQVCAAPHVMLLCIADLADVYLLRRKDLHVDVYSVHVLQGNATACL